MASFFHKPHFPVLKFLTLTFFANILYCYSYGIASEVDSYTHVERIKEDATDVINREINALMKKAVLKANQEKAKEAEELYQIIDDVLGGFIVSEIEEALEKRNDRRIMRVNIRDSIYAGLNTFLSPSIAISKRIGGVFRIQDSIIGTDKIGHFISQGYTYFETCYLKGEGVEKALLYGINSELTYFGFYATGVFSFGDLVANFQGMRFWNDLLAKYPDILGESQAPYMKYENGKWEFARAVDMRRYFDTGWDERINHNVFRNSQVDMEVNRRISQSGVSATRSGPQGEEQFEKRYKRYAIYLFNSGKITREYLSILRQKLKLVLKQRIMDNYRRTFLKIKDVIWFYKGSGEHS
jgi:hypothetical protein